MLQYALLHLAGYDVVKVRRRRCMLQDDYGGHTCRPLFELRSGIHLHLIFFFIPFFPCRSKQLDLLNQLYRFRVSGENENIRICNTRKIVSQVLPIMSCAHLFLLICCKIKLAYQLPSLLKWVFFSALCMRVRGDNCKLVDKEEKVAGDSERAATRAGTPLVTY